LTIPADEIVLSDNAQASLDSLESSDRQKASVSASIAKRARGYRDTLLRDCQHGEVVRKSRIPRYFREVYGIENLYVEDLPNFWRMMYTIVKAGGKRLVVILEIVDHESCDRLFQFRGN
jgi:hypothetical protein